MKNFQDFQEATRLKKETGYDVGGTKKPLSKSKDSVMDAVKKSITAQYGKGAIMRSGSNQKPKVKGAKTDGEGKYLKQHKANQKLKSDAKEMGYGDDEDTEDITKLDRSSLKDLIKQEISNYFENEPQDEVDINDIIETLTQMGFSK